MDSRLSSERPLVFPRSSSLASSTASLASKATTSVGAQMVLSKASTWSCARGKPSTRNLPSSLPPLEDSMAFLSAPSTMGVFTSPPASMTALSSTPSWDPLATSARSRSPVLKCLYPNSLEMRSHWVPLPLPGPPRTNTRDRGPLGTGGGGGARRATSAAKMGFTSSNTAAMARSELRIFTMLGLAFW